MKEQIIVITGKQGSGKTTMANKLAEYYSFRRVYEREKKPAEIVDYDGVIKDIDKGYLIVVVNKESLINALETIGERNYIIIDTDNK